MNRRSLLKSAAAMAVGAPLLSVANATPAHAAGNYDVLLTEQLKNKVMLFRAIESWEPKNLGWSWTAPTSVVNGENTWRLLSDARFRETDRFGWVCLVTASGGKVGMVDFGDDDALLWSATPYGNPHAIEYIRSHGVVVVASSQKSAAVDYDGFLTIYAPTDADDPGTLAAVDTITYAGAHGLWWDGSHLFALGARTLAKYRVTGSLRTSRLELVQKHVWSDTEPFWGHSLDMDFTDPGRLLLNGAGAVWTVDKANLALTNIRPGSYGVKSFSRAVDGESFWVQAIDQTNPGETGWWNEYVQFFDAAGKPTYRRGLDYYGYEGRIYRSRIASVRLS
ncbi:hypothetical protein OHB11_16890 [Streptomyces zaomyceticus]|uniref:Uncharacterized protein n=1 Tax=Streptomyces zaomyceticus TaxID=68286 RepID=A0ABZ1L913_9ACTN|nr:hypothetical protein OG237_24610 [Streptomyces zaomyceticus]